MQADRLNAESGAQIQQHITMETRNPGQISRYQPQKQPEEEYCTHKNQKPSQEALFSLCCFLLQMLKTCRFSASEIQEKTEAEQRV